MAGLYIHIPYCKTRCIYCDFYKETDESTMERFTKSLCLEFILRKDEADEPIKTIYFGGGTPTRLHATHFEDIFSHIYSNYNVLPDAEITIEANPDDLNDEYITLIKQLPVNRISIGIQSFDDKELKFLSRRHSAQEAVDAVKRCQQDGFDNISIDLIYGLPNQTLSVWESNIQKAINLGIQHISAYHLIYEENTKLYTLLERGRVTPVADDISIEMFSMLISKLKDSGFEQYEISNFAKNGQYSKHNTSYWLDHKYIGFGPSAHSYNGEKRSWNISSIGKYMLAIENNELLQESEVLSEYEKYNEFILTKLRMMKGMNLNDLRSHFGDKLYDYCMQIAKKYIDEQLLIVEGDMLRLTQKGIFISDGIMSSLMWID